MINCPNGHGEMSLTNLDKTMKFRGIVMDLNYECYVCPVCGLEAGSIEQGAAIQRLIAKFYHRHTGIDILRGVGGGT